ncbi:MAG: DinB family protein [Phycisphaerales bacterium]|nr:DinB family protein [Phycisphaerales bacterium]
MGSLAQTVIAPQGPLLRYAEKLLEGVTPAQFARQPLGRNGIIDTNHPAFIFGHLSVYPARICAIAGITDSALANPPGFEGLFAAGSVCKDDPDGTTYPPMQEVTAHFFEGHRQMFARLAELSDEQLAAPHGQENDFSRAFPSRAALLAFYVGPHPFTHIGQMSAWRRCMGLPSAF